MRILLLLMTFASSSAFAKTALICRSYQKIDGWKAYSTYDFLRFTAYVESNIELTRAEVEGAYGSDIRDLEADPKYKSINSRYRDYNRFGALEDAWNWFLPLLPKDLTERKGSFRAYIQIVDEEGGASTVSLKCFLKERE